MSRHEDDAGLRRRALYAAGRAERPSAAARSATLIALAEAEAKAKTGSNDTARSPRAANAASPIGWGLVGGAVLVAMAFGIRVGTRSEQSPGPEAAAMAIVSTVQPPATTSALAPETAASADEPTPATVTVDSLPSRALPVVRARVESAPAQKLPAPPSAPAAAQTNETAKNDVPRRDSTSALAEEVQRMQAIRSQLRAGHADEAMRLIAEYRKDFPAGALADEAAVLQVESLIKLGHNAEATLLARSFLAERPRSPYSARVSSLLSSIGSHAESSP